VLIAGGPFWNPLTRLDGPTPFQVVTGTLQTGKVARVPKVPGVPKVPRVPKVPGVPEVRWF
jgi:hypothetical protein